MKASSKALMTGIFLGLTAWLLDAWFSAVFFPDVTFVDAISFSDPERTVYMRATVVMLFFMFGLYAGHLLLRLEGAKEQEARMFRVVNGLQRMTNAMVRENRPEELVRKSCELITDLMEVPYVWMALTGEDFQLKELVVSREERWVEALRGELLAGKWPEKLRRVLATDEPVIERQVPRTLAGDGGMELPLGHALIFQRLSHKGRVHGFIGMCVPATVLGRRDVMGLIQEVGRDLGAALGRLEEGRKLALQERKAREKLQATREMLSRTQELAGMGSWEVDADNKQVRWSAEFWKLLGREPGSLEPAEEDLEGLGVWRHEEEARFWKALERAMSSGEPFEMEVEMRRGDGGGLQCVIHGAPEVDEQGRVRRVLGFVLDETDIMTAEMERLQLQEKLHQSGKMESLGALAGGFAHEFNNILQAVMGNASLGGMQLDNPEAVRGCLMEIEQSCTRASMLCDQILTFAGKKPVLLSMMNPDELVESLEATLVEEIGEEGTLRVHTNESECRIQGNAKELEQILGQLVRNAAESRDPQRGLEIDIDTSLEVLDGEEQDRLHVGSAKERTTYWVLRVRDNGCGIREEDLGRIFDPFYSTKFLGRGLGLSSVHGIVKSFGGAIEAWSTPDEGATFALYFPCIHLEASKEVKKSAARQPAEKTSGGKLIWVVDDEPLICNTLERLLGSWGFEVRSVSDGEAILKNFEESRLETLCVLLDMTMPGLSGTEVCASLRFMAPEVPVVIMSGYSAEQTLEEFKENEISGFLHKPFNSGALRELLENVVSREDWPSACNSDG